MPVVPEPPKMPGSVNDSYAAKYRARKAAERKVNQSRRCDRASIRWSAAHHPCQILRSIEIGIHRVACPPVGRNRF